MLTRDARPETRNYFPSRVKGQQLLLRLVHLRRPDSFFFVELHGRGMIWNRHIGGRGPFARPVLELRMQRRKFLDIVPDSFQGGLDDLVRNRFMTDEVNIIREDTGIANDSRGGAALKDRDIVTGNCLSDTRLALSGTV